MVVTIEYICHDIDVDIFPFFDHFVVVGVVRRDELLIFARRIL